LLATFADDTAILTKGTDFQEAAVKAQKALLDITNWTKKWKIKLNQQKSAHINFTYKKNKKKIRLEMYGQPIPFVNEAKYLGMNLDVRLKWKAHIKKKKDEL
jgi:predicted SpoU family rRNA methylase